MIQVTTLSGQSLTINCDQIQYIESAPDTIICFVNGARIPVKESVAEINGKVIEFKRKLTSERQ